jgi:hypothetical protein
MKKIIMLLILVIATEAMVFGQEKQDTVYGIQLFTTYNYFPNDDLSLSWDIHHRYLENDTTLHAIYLFGIDEERNIKLIDSISNICNSYTIIQEKAQKYKSFFIGYKIGSTFLRSNELKP